VLSAFYPGSIFFCFLYWYPHLFLEISITVLLYHDLEHLLDQYRQLSNKYNPRIVLILTKLTLMSQMLWIVSNLHFLMLRNWHMFTCP